MLSFVAYMEKNKNAKLKDFADDYGMPQSYLPPALIDLVKKGFLKKLGRGLYSPTTIFHEYVPELMEISRKKKSVAYTIDAVLTPKEAKMIGAQEGEKQPEQEKEQEEVKNPDIPASVQVDLKDDILSLSVGKVRINIYTGE